MAWVVDTCVLLDIRLGDPNFVQTSVECLSRYSEEGLVLAPISYIELAPQFRGDRKTQDAFLNEYDVEAFAAWNDADTFSAHTLWATFTERRKVQSLSRRPVADVLIAAFAARFQGLITRNMEDFRKVAPNLPLVDASAFKPIA